MPLDPRAKRFLDMVNVVAPLDPSRMTIAERRHSFARLMQLCALDVPIGRSEDRLLPGPAGAIAIRVYTPAAAADAVLPGLIYLHGGGMVAGNLDTHDVLCRMLTNAAGCRLVAVDYRIAPEHKFPAALEDAYAATQGVCDRAVEFGIDPGRFGIGGDSAGGALATVVCQMAKRTGRIRLALQVLLCPVLDVRGDMPSRQAYARGYLLDQMMMERDFEHYASSGLDAGDPRVSPLRATDLGGLPPALIHTAEFDPLRDEGKAYAERLAGAGVPVAYSDHPGMIHHFLGMAALIPYARTGLAAVGAEIRAALAARPDTH